MEDRDEEKVEEEGIGGKRKLAQTSRGVLPS